MYAYNVYLNGKRIDTVFATETGTIAERCESVRRSLIHHDGYDAGIYVAWPKGQRVTRDYWELQGNYGHGWETLCAGTTYREVKANRREYRENGDFAPMRVIMKRERI